MRHTLAISLILAAASAAGCQAGSPTFGFDSGYPAAAPGSTRLEHHGTSITALNTALSVAWKLDPSGLKPASLRDEVTGQSLTFTNEVFQLLLTNGQRYAASKLRPEGTPRITELAVQPQAARMAARIPGRQLELPLRSADDRLRVIWRILALDGANYVRQEIEITALKEACAIQDIVWLDETIPGGRMAGRVDGSPLVAGNFFLGAEDPHAMNPQNSNRRELGGWLPADLEYGKIRTKTWPIPEGAIGAGDLEVVFQYQAGPHRLDIHRVVLLEDGQEVAHDGHHGSTGSANAENIYLLSLPKLKSQARYELAADLSTDPDFKLPAGARLDSRGTVAIAGSGGRLVCQVRRNAALHPGETLTQSLVMGVAPAGQMRRAFLYYLERERAHPYRPFLHYNSWYDIAWHPFALNETNCLEAIRIFGERFIKPYGVVMDAMVFDDGWDNPRSLWQFHSGFPRGFSPLAELCRQNDTRLGVWLSPFGGYGEPRDQRLKFGKEQGYEINATGFSMAGPKYYAAFKQACVRMIREYGVNHFKFDGIATGMYASGGADYMRDTEAMRRLMLELRREDPNLYINLTTGSWPSPFWLRFADSVWRQGGDMGYAGKGSKQQQWLTYRDQETFRNIVRKGRLYPLNSLMNQGVAYSREGSAGDPTFNSAGFRDDVRAFFGSGTGLQELYIQPGKLNVEDWRVLAEGAKWSRANADVLVDTHWIGGDPSRLEVYGYASWNQRKGVVMLRNPDDRVREFALDVATAFELPPGANTRYRLQSPWPDAAGVSPLETAGGHPVTLTLQPFEVLVFDATPRP